MTALSEKDVAFVPPLDTGNVPDVTFDVSNSGISVLVSETYESDPFPPVVLTHPFDVVSNVVAFVAESAFPSKSATSTPFVPEKTSDVFVAAVNIVNLFALSSYPINPKRAFVPS